MRYLASLRETQLGTWSNSGSRKAARYHKGGKETTFGATWTAGLDILARSRLFFRPGADGGLQLTRLRAKLELSLACDQLKSFCRRESAHSLHYARGYFAPTPRHNTSPHGPRELCWPSYKSRCPHRRRQFPNRRSSQQRPLQQDAHSPGSQPRRWSRFRNLESHALSLPARS